MNLQGPHEISGTRGQALRSNLTNYLPGTGRPTNKRKVERGDRPPVPPQPTTSPDTGRPTSLVPGTNVGYLASTLLYIITTKNAVTGFQRIRLL